MSNTRREYMGGVPGSRITQFDLGDKNGNFNVKVSPDPAFDIELCRRVNGLPVAPAEEEERPMSSMFQQFGAGLVVHGALADHHAGQKGPQRQRHPERRERPRWRMRVTGAAVRSELTTARGGG